MNRASRRVPIFAVTPSPPYVVWLPGSMAGMVSLDDRPGHRYKKG